MKRIFRDKKKEKLAPEERKALMREMIDFYLKQGFNVIPIKDADKQAAIEWKEFQTVKITAAQIEQWFFSGGTFNVGIICGRISDNLVVVDFDDEKIWKKVKAYLKLTFTTKTARGVHLYYRTSIPIRGFKIPDLGIDVKGEGGYVLAPPSLHPEGVFYTEIYRPHTEENAVTVINGDFKEELLSMLSRFKDFKADKLHDKVDIGTLLEGVAKGERNEAAIRVASWFRKREMSREEAWEQLLLWNQKNKPPEDDLLKLETTFRSAYDNEPYNYNFGETESSEREFWTAKDVKEANELLNSPEILVYVKNKALGEIIGNEKFKVALFLINLHYGNAHILGDTATGKSHITDRVMRCFPLHTWYKITGVTDKAIRYLATEIKHLYLAEWGAVGTKKDEESTAAYDIKILMSEGRLDILVVQKTEAGTFQTQIVKTSVKNIISTHTNVELPEQLQNRAWELAPEIRTAEVAQSKLEQREKMEDRADCEPQRRVLRCAIEILESERPDKFVIPYAKQLYKIFEPLTERTRTTRDVDKLCNLIEASALLHYRNRPILERNSKRWLVCLPEDFVNAWTIGDEACVGTFVELTKRGEEAFEACKRIIEKDKELTAINLASVTNTTQQVAGGWLRKFERFGMLVLTERGPKGTKIYDLPETTTDKDIVVDLPMRELYNAYEEWQRKYSLDEQMNDEKRDSKKYLEKIFQIRFPSFIHSSERLRLLPDRKQEVPYRASIG